MNIERPHTIRRPVQTSRIRSGAPGRRGARALGPRRRAPVFFSLLAVLAMAPALTAQERVEARHDLTPNARLSLGGIHHEVTVEVWDRNEVEVIAMLDRDRETLQVTGSAEDLSIRVEQTRGRTVQGRGSLEVRVPRGVRLTVSTVSGAQRIDGVSGTIRLNSVSGATEFSGDPQSAEVNNVSGNIRVSGAIPRVTVNSVSGVVDLQGVRGRLDVNTVSGNVEVGSGGALDHVRGNSVSGRFTVVGRVAPEASIELTSHSGSIVLRVPAGTPGEYEIDTMSGRIDNRLTSDEATSPRYGPGRSLTFRVGDGSTSIRLKSFSGGVALEPLR